MPSQFATLILATSFCNRPLLSRAPCPRQALVAQDHGVSIPAQHPSHSSPLKSLSLVGRTTLPAEGIMANDRLVVFIDSNAVLSWLVSGRCGNEVDGKIFHQVLEWEYSAKSVCWYERLPSAANVADGPSRGDKSGRFEP